jgi:hypothetical protein
MDTRGITFNLKAAGLEKKIDLVNQAIGLYKEADRLLEEANLISVTLELA